MENGVGDIPRSHGCRRVVFWLLCLWLMAWLGICIDQAVGFTDFGQGLASGVIQGSFLAPFLMIPLIAAGLIGWAIGSIKCLRPVRWRISLLVPLILALLPVIERVQDRLEPGRRFERMTKMAFPQNTRNLVVSFSGGFLMDLTQVYTFECSKEQTDALIERLVLKKSETIDSNVHGMPRADFSPVRWGWKGTERWKPQEDVGNTDFFELFTDESHTRVHIVYGTI